MPPDDLAAGRLPRHQLRREQRRLEAFRSFCQAAVARAKAQAGEIDWDAISDEESEHSSRVYELSWRATIEKDAEAKQALDQLREKGDEVIAELDQQEAETRAWSVRREQIRSAEARRRTSDLLISNYASYWRPTGRERRPSCNTGIRGSRRITRAGPPSSDDDPHEDGESDGRFSRPLSLGVG